MNYELAKQLKDAGFPQKKDGKHIPHKCMIECDCTPTSIPTLSELIEACGDKLYSMKRSTMKGEGQEEIQDCWKVAESVDIGESPITIWEIELDVALAKLW